MQVITGKHDCICVDFQITIFMTHMSNYGNDRLGLYTFESVVKFIRCWTNFQLRTVRPLELGKIYFDMYPEEEDPIWRVRIISSQTIHSNRFEYKF